jgi:hypothetical protein
LRKASHEREENKTRPRGRLGLNQRIFQNHSKAQAYRRPIRANLLGQVFEQLRIDSVAAVHVLGHFLHPLKRAIEFPQIVPKQG